MKFILSLLPLLAIQAAALKLAEPCGASVKLGGITLPAATDKATAPDACTMQIKSAGKGVEALQSAINSCYKPLLKDGVPLKVDGDFGAKTEAALKSVQAKLGVPADGVYGPSTRAKLEFFDEAAGKCVAYGK
jgi:peptidoglycan hydrolase-like protein with peptidoglycan-binding domain